jgi:hypothetical protein
MSTKENYIYTNIKGEEGSFTADTRTFLYFEVMSSVHKSGNLLMGNSASGSYYSHWFFDLGGAMKGKRFGSEVGILNIFLYDGIIGVIIYFFLLFSISFIAIRNSNNDLSKMLGLLIASRWMLSFVEEYTDYDLNFYFFWLIMGLVSTTSFRMMNNKQMKNYIKQI